MSGSEVSTSVVKWREVLGEV